VIELKCNTILEGKFDVLTVIPTADDAIQFWKLVPYNSFLNIRKFVQRYICHSVSAYFCEQAFSLMEQIKDEQRPQHMDCNCKNMVILTATVLQPVIDKLAGVKQRQRTQ
jgi:hypothetical protein